MKAEERRRAIAKTLTAEHPVSATALAGQFSVSRQIIVGDIALLRAKASDQGISEIKQADGRLLVTFAETDFARLSVLCGDPAYKGRLLLNAGSTPYVSLRLNKDEAPMDMARRLVDGYASTAQGTAAAHA